MRNTLKSTVTSLLLAASPISHADGVPGIDFSAGTGFMRLQPSGTFIQDGPEPNRQWPLDLPSLPLAQNDTVPYVWASLETIAPVVPHFRAEYWRFAAVQSAQDTAPGVTNVRSDFSLTNTALTAYYSPLNNWIKLDMGLQLRWLDVTARIVPNDESAAQSRLQIPLLGVYGQAVFELPFTGVTLGASYAGLDLGGNRFSETSARLAWQHGFLGAELGYRRLSLDIQDGPYRLDTAFDGPYAGIIVAF